jgi:hypothetical protein
MIRPRLYGCGGILHRDGPELAEQSRQAMGD